MSTANYANVDILRDLTLVAFWGSFCRRNEREASESRASQHPHGSISCDGGSDLDTAEARDVAWTIAKGWHAVTKAACLYAAADDDYQNRMQTLENMLIGISETASTMNADVDVEAPHFSSSREDDVRSGFIELIECAQSVLAQPQLVQDYQFGEEALPFIWKNPVIEHRVGFIFRQFVRATIQANNSHGNRPVLNEMQMPAVLLHMIEHMAASRARCHLLTVVNRNGCRQMKEFLHARATAAMLAELQPFINWLTEHELEQPEHWFDEQMKTVWWVRTGR